MVLLVGVELVYYFLLAEAVAKPKIPPNVVEQNPIQRLFCSQISILCTILWINVERWFVFQRVLPVLSLSINYSIRFQKLWLHRTCHK